MYKIAAIQTNSTDNLKLNLLKASDLLRQAAAKGAELALLPENFAYFQSKPGQLIKYAENPASGPIQEFLQQSARDLKIWIIGGSLLIRGPDNKIYNRCIVYDSKGQEVDFYNKIHLFDVNIENGEQHTESAEAIAGDKPVTVPTPFGKIGLSICYDLRFPCLYQRLMKMGAQIIVVPAAFTKVTGQAHWQVLLRARAIETQTFVVAAAQTGLHPGGRQTFGHSMLVSPWGEIIGKLDTNPGVLLGEINLSELKRIRQSMPVHEHQTNID